MRLSPTGVCVIKHKAEIVSKLGEYAENLTVGNAIHEKLSADLSSEIEWIGLKVGSLKLITVEPQ